MKVSYDINEFVEINDGDIRRIISYLVKKPELHEDLVQNFYLALISNHSLDKFDRSVPNIPKFFARYIWKCCSSSVTAFMNDKRRLGDPSWVSEYEGVVGGEEGIKDIFEVLSVDGTGVPSVEVHPGYNHVLENSSFCEVKFSKMLDAFQREVGEDDGLTQKTKDRCARYLVSAKSGIKPTDFADEEGVTPTYVTRVRMILRSRYEDFCLRHDGGFDLASDV